MIGHGVVLRGGRLLHGRRLQDVAEDHGLLPKQLEVGVHELAERVLLPIIGESQFLHRFVPAGSQHGGIGFGGLRRRLHRRRPYHKGDAHLGHVGRTDRRGLFVYTNAENCHTLFPHFPARFFSSL